MRVFKRVMSIYTRILEATIVVLIFVLLVDVGIQILSRYISFIPRFLWTVDVVNMTLTWVIFLGSAVGVREGRHFFIDILPQHMNPSADRTLRVIYYFFMFAVTAVYIRYGYRFLQMGYVQTSPTIGLNLAWVYASVPVAGISWALFLVENVYDEFAQKKQPLRPEQIEGELPQ